MPGNIVRLGWWSEAIVRCFSKIGYDMHESYDVV